MVFCLTPTFKCLLVNFLCLIYFQSWFKWVYFMKICALMIIRKKTNMHGSTNFFPSSPLSPLNYNKTSGWCVLIQKKGLTIKHFKFVSTLLVGWFAVMTLENVKSTLKQRCVRQRCNLQCWATSNQGWLFQRWYEKL